MKNKIPQILKERRINASQFHVMLIQGGDRTHLSYPVAFELATKPELRGEMQLKNIAKAVTALGITFNDAIELVEVKG